MKFAGCFANDDDIEKLLLERQIDLGLDDVRRAIEEIDQNRAQQIVPLHHHSARCFELSKS